eukprot:jgi/Bigna1/80504/fgenesh1_pg.71_\
MEKKIDEKELLEKSKKWAIFYPNYINSLRTYAQGRKIAKKDCCDNPTALEIAHIASALKLRFVLERAKLHPRTFMLKPNQVILPGRVRVELWNEKKEPVNKTIPTRKAFMEFAGQKIPTLKIRHERIKQVQARLQAQQAAAEKVNSKKGRNKKKGKKGKRR